MVLVSAPPGYGKTTLVAGWLQSEGLAGAWLTLDESDNDPAVFLAYLVAAVRRAVPGLDPDLDRSAASSAISAASLAPLLNGLAALSVPFAVVLDDYHMVSNRAIHDIVTTLTRHLPPNVRVVVVTRHDPPLPLARLRVRGLLTEVRATDLRFSARDAFRFLAETMGLEIAQPTAERLTARTEGWIAGLQLAALSLRRSADAEAFVEAFGSSDRYIFDYLTDEALASLPPAATTFLESTCILDRLSGPLCDALTGRKDGAAMLDDLAEANLFLTPLDERREWFRYHGLFADLLSSGLTEGRRLELHRAAAAWFAGHDLPHEGIRHYLAANEPAQAATLMTQVVETTLARAEFRTFTAWCDALPPDVLAANPTLGLMRAWALFFLGDIAGAELALEELARSSDADEDLNGRRACLEAWFANRHDRPDAEGLAQRAIDRIPDGDPLFRSLAFTTLGESLIGRDVGRAREAFEQAHRLARVAGRSALLAGSVYSLANADLVHGRRTEAESRCRRSIEEWTGGSALTPPWLGMVYLPLGVALFEADELALARQQIATGHELCERAGLRVTMLGAAEWYEVLCLHLLREPEQAWRRLEAVRREAVRHGIDRVAIAMTLLAAELLLLEDDAPSAHARIEGQLAARPEVLGTTRDRSRLTRARVNLALGRPAEALGAADPLAVEQRADGRFGRLLATLVVMAEARRRTGDPDGSLRALAEAVTLAEGQGYRRVFLDPVVPLDGLLPRVRHVAPSFVDGLLARAGIAARPAPAAAQPRAVPDDGGGALVEPLSVREIEVLRLVAAGLSNDEIGRELYVSRGTAKWHVHNVLAKLGARNRVALVARARSLGLV